jgi:hypothetical protein
MSVIKPDLVLLGYEFIPAPPGWSFGHAVELVFETGSSYVVQAGVKPTILLPRSRVLGSHQWMLRL